MAWKLLKKMHSQRIPGWSIQWSTLYIPPNIPLEYMSLTPTEVVSKYIEDCKRDSRLATESQISELEDRMDNLDIEQEHEEMELLCEELSALECHSGNVINTEVTSIHSTPCQPNSASRQQCHHHHHHHHYNTQKQQRQNSNKLLVAPKSSFISSNIELENSTKEK